MSKDSRSLSFRIRKVDDDLLKAIENIPNAELSRMCRDGLRLMLGLKTTRTYEVQERRIEMPDLISPNHIVRAQKAVWKPK